MVKFLLGIITGAVLAVVFLIILVFAAARLRERPPSVPANSVLVLELEGEIPERAPVEWPVPFLSERARPAMSDVWMLLRKAAADSRIKAVVLEPHGLGVGWAKMQEIRAGLEQFRKSGKPVFTFLQTPGAREYYLAAASDRVYLGPQDWLNLKGMRVELMYFKQTLDKLGVNVQIVHAGKYKDFGDLFTRTSMSPETREVLNSILDQLYGNLLEGIARARRKSVEEVRAILDQGPFLAEQARAHGLVDELRFEDQVFGELKDRLKSGELRKVSVATYMRVPPGSLGLEGRSRIALVVGQGEITRGGLGGEGVSEEGLTSEGFNQVLRRVENDSGIKGVVVRIDSPGGEVTASDEIWRQMGLLSHKKPTIISFSDTAASGGYYIALTGDPIVAYPGTITGSIGVVFGKADLHGLYNKLGITKDMLTRGRFAAIDSDYKPLDAAEMEKLRESIDDNYRDFVAKVAQARKRSFTEMEPVAQGRVWLGAQARERGLVDELGGLDRAIELVKQKARIPPGEKVTVEVYPRPRSVLDVLFGRGREGMVEARLAPLLKAWRPWMEWGSGRFLRLMPFVVEVK